MTDITPCKEKVNLVTLRFPTPARYSKMYRSLNKKFDSKLITGSIFPTYHLRMNLTTTLAYASVFAKVLQTITPIIIDINAFSVTNVKLKKNIVVDFRTPFSYELNWLGHGLLASVHAINEKNLNNVGLVTAANDLMAKYCTDLGAKDVVVVPNYPQRDFKFSIEGEKWKNLCGLPADSNVVLFTGGVRLREIYGIDMLLQSWKLVEKADSNSLLVILGDDSIDYASKLARSLNLQRVMLPGRVSVKDIANWINSATVCVAPRTPGFSNAFYNDQDSTKISEYAALEKPIVANSYWPSEQYLLVDSTPEAFAEGIMKGIDGQIKPSKAHFWEDTEPILLDLLERFWFG